jgi:hypothetical protein
VLSKLFLFFGGKSHIHWPVDNFFGTLSSPQWKHLFGPQLQNKNKCSPLQPTFSVYIHENWTLGKPYRIKLRCYWEHFGQQRGNSGNLKGTCWEHIGNKEEKQKKTSHHPTPKRKTKGPSCVHAEPSHWLPSLDPKSQNRNNHSPLWSTISIHIYGSWTLGKPYGIKLRCYWEQLGNLRSPREHIENQKNPSPSLKKLVVFAPIHAW